MKTVVVPDLASFTSATDFLRALIDRNVERNPKLSIRWFAQKLDWPASYINDVFVGRRQFTLQRALELAKKLNLDLLQSEHLILLALAGSREPDVGRHFASELKTRFNTERVSESGFLRPLQNLATIAVFGLVGWAERRLSNHEIRQALYTFPELHDDMVEAALNELERSGLITFDDDGKVKMNRSRIDMDIGKNAVEGVPLFHAALDSLRQYVESPRRQSPGFFQFKVLTLPERYVQMAQERFHQFSAWLSEVEFREDKSVADQEENIILQMSFFLVPIVDPAALESE